MMLPSEIKRETLIKSQDATDVRFGKKPAERPIGAYVQKGVINLDKPAGPTSHEVTSWVKKILELEKAGHSGTLDPNVTGLLPVMLGDATKAVDALLTAGKEYICLMKLHTEVPEKKIKSVLSEFTGEIFQKPSIKSAVKRETRTREIYYFELLEIEDNNLLFKVGCEAGTYIRKLCHDMGLAAGTGAHMQELRRTKTGPFREDETLVTLHDLQDAYIAWKENSNEVSLRKVVSPMESGLSHLPRIVIRDNAVDAVCHGAPTKRLRKGRHKCHASLRPRGTEDAPASSASASGATSESQEAPKRTRERRLVRRQRVEHSFDEAIGEVPHDLREDPHDRRFDRLPDFHEARLEAFGAEDDLCERAGHCRA